MNTILEILFTLTAAGSVVAAFMLGLRRVSVELLPAKWRYGLGKMAVAFYLCPIALGIPLISRLLAARPATVQPAQPTPFSELSPEQTISAHVAILLLCLWAVGAIGFVAWQLYCYQRFLKSLEHTRTPVPKSSDTSKQLFLIKNALGLKSNVELAYSSLIRSPVLVGLGKPAIYLPKENVANLDMTMVFHHELIHLKRKDLWVKAFTLAASALHWFNPLVHMLRKDIHTWSELACDEEVVKRMSYAERKRYGETILNVMAGSRHLPVQFCASLSGEGKQLKRRLTVMLNVKELNKKNLLLTLAALLLIAAIGTATAIWASHNTPKVVDRDSAPASDQPLSTGIDNEPTGSNTRQEPSVVHDPAPSDTQQEPATDSASDAIESQPIPAVDQASTPAEAQPRPIAENSSALAEAQPAPAVDRASAPAETQLRPVADSSSALAEAQPAPAVDRASVPAEAQLRPVAEGSSAPAEAAQ
ncbi:M56 family metallopeptidase [Cohnella boryungensis]|uniref:M56 family metallopeptidase n=1 Tax=Cohnella boryungensis TaxID=768479 RepID=A0ABV8S9V6_9BACL